MYGLAGKFQLNPELFHDCDVITIRRLLGLFATGVTCAANPYCG